MKPFGFQHGRSDIYYREEGDSDDFGQDKLRRPPAATAETAPGGRLSTTQNWMYAIAELNEFNGKDKDEDRGTSWIDKVKSAFLRYQAPDVEKCLVLRICLQVLRKIGTVS